MNSPAPETTDLHQCLRDLTALSALSAYWSRAEMTEIAGSLAEILLRILPVEFVYVRAGTTEATAHKTIPLPDGPANRERVRDIGKAIGAVVKLGIVDLVPTMPNPFGDGETRLATIPIGFTGNCGIVAAGSRQADFPTATDELLMRVAANQTAVVVQHKWAEESLRQSETRLRLFIEHAPAAIAMLDRDMRYVAVSRRWLTDYRIPEADITGRSHYDFFNPDSNCGMDLHQRCLAGAVEKCDEDHFERDGIRENVRWEVHPWRDHHGVIGGIVIFTEVITQKKRAEEALREADRRKDEFLATVAHELRNPLAPIRNAVQILQVKELPEAESQWARDVIDRQVHIMTRLVDDLLDLSRIAQGKLRIRKERIPLTTLVNTSLESSRPNIQKWGHDVSVTYPPEPIYLDADPTRIEQVLANLLNNAAKYTPQGGHISLSAEREGERVAIRVKDSGIGIPPDMLPRIFEMFTQVDRSLGRSQEGLGIGLALVQRLVELHGGTIEAHSAGVGQGSEFVVRLPLAVERTRPGESAVSNNGQLTGPARRRILVVDDNKDAAICLAKLLAKSGNEVTTAYDGLEAVEAAAQFRPDLVLLDIGLPKIDGYEAARRIRELPGGSEMVLIAVTGWGHDEDRRLSEEAGFQFHLIKPIEPETLEGLVSRAQKRSQ